MLLEFHVKNFALAEDLSIALGGGLNVITGETGSGKSVIVNAVSIMLGRKASPSYVRQGADKALLEGVFEWRPPAAIRGKIAEAGIELEDEETLTITREISASGRSTARINSRVVTAALLREIGEALADLHGQYQHQALLRCRDHTAFVDLLGPAKHKKNLESYSKLYRELAALRARRREISEGAQRREEEKDLLLYRISEIEDSVTGQDEYDELEEEVKLLENAAGISQSASEAWNLVARNGADTSALNRLAEASSKLRDVEELEERVTRAISAIVESEAMLEEAARELRSAASELEPDPARLSELQDRQLEIKALMKKNRCDTVAALLEYRDEARRRVGEIDSADHSAGELDKDIKEKEAALVKLAGELTSGRKSICTKLEKQMKIEMAELAMDGARFKVEFVEAGGGDGMPGPGGAEALEFLISANPGEPLHPLADVASGGELSRVMLAFKTILCEHDPVPVLIFDEIDSGIGGVTAWRVGGKMARLGNHRQVVAITHLPQIAAFGDSHLTVFKKKQAGRTVIQSNTVGGDERLAELGRMLGDSGEKNATISMARELLKEAGRVVESA